MTCRVPNLVPQQPPPESRVPATLAAVRVARGKRSLRRESTEKEEKLARSAEQTRSRHQMVKMLRQFDAAPPVQRKPPPTSDLSPAELAGLRARMTAALGEAGGRVQPRGQHVQPEATVSVARVRATSLARHQLGRFLALLAPRRRGDNQETSPRRMKQSADECDEWMLGRLWAACNTAPDGCLSETELLQGLGGAFSKSLAVRLRWNWQTFYDVDLRGELGAHDIFSLLEQVPVGSRLEGDALLLCRLASTKLRFGQRAALTMAEYLGVYADDAAEELNEPDALRLRCLPPHHRASAEAVRARARGLLQAQQLLDAADAAGAGRTSVSKTL